LGWLFLFSGSVGNLWVGKGKGGKGGKGLASSELSKVNAKVELLDLIVSPFLLV
jgi:hypothetical protein